MHELAIWGTPDSLFFKTYWFQVTIFWVDCQFHEAPKLWIFKVFPSFKESTCWTLTKCKGGGLLELLFKCFCWPYWWDHFSALLKQCACFFSCYWQHHEPQAVIQLSWRHSDFLKHFHSIERLPERYQLVCCISICVGIYTDKTN